MDLMEELDKAWNEAEIVDVINKGDTAIIRFEENDYTISVFKVTSKINENTEIRRYKKAEVVVPDDAVAVIAELSWQSWAGRQVFLRSGGDKNLWVSETQEEVTLENLKDIRVIKDEGEFL